MMFFRLVKEGFLFAVNSIIVNKLRTFLSLFGITIGIFAIISVFTVLDWMESSIKDSIATLGDDIIYVQKMPWSFDPSIAWWDIIMWPQPDMDDYEAIRRKSASASAANYSVYFGRNLKYRERQLSNAMIWSTTHELENV
ncbi:MAG: ABC transporter permease, partial [Bacteroidales bacterium]|nr:ABC transporter permease [Bacteroidales bacterium]